MPVRQNNNYKQYRLAIKINCINNCKGGDEIAVGNCEAVDCVFYKLRPNKSPIKFDEEDAECEAQRIADRLNTTGLRRILDDPR